MPRVSCGQRQQADQNVSLGEKAGQSLGPVKARDPVDLLRAPAPAGDREPEGLEALDGRIGQYAQSEKAHATLAGLMRRKRLPDAILLLRPIGGQLPVQGEHAERDIFLHHADDAVLDHAHQLDTCRQPLPVELVDAGADREQHFEIAVARRGLRAPSR